MRADLPPIPTTPLEATTYVMGMADALLEQGLDPVHTLALIRADVALLAWRLKYGDAEPSGSEGLTPPEAFGLGVT